MSGIDGLPGAKHVHNGQIFALFGKEPGTIRGAVFGGLNGIFAYQYKNVLCFLDDGNCGNCEAGMSGAATYIFAVNAMKHTGY